MEKAKVSDLLLQGVPANVTGGWVEAGPYRESGRGNVVARLVGADGTGAATVTIEGSNDPLGTTGVLIGAAMALTQAAPVKAVAVDYPWPYLRAVVSAVAVNATGLKVTLAQ
jgi:hypothetical protein